MPLQRPTTFMGQNTIFPTPQTSLQVTKLMARSTTLDFFAFRTASLKVTKMRPNGYNGSLAYGKKSTWAPIGPATIRCGFVKCDLG